MPQKLLKVKSNRDDARVVLYESDPRHPDGEAFVAGAAGLPKEEWPVVLVYATPGVMGKLAERQLIEVGSEKGGPELEDVDGIGPARADAMREELGILTVGDLAGADVNLIGAHFGTTEDTAQKWIDSANAVLKKSEG